MTYTVETSLENFPAWSGGKDTLDVLIEKDLCDTVEAILNDIFVDGAPTDTEINDTLWFSRDEIAEWCGFSSWEALENGEEEEEEETAEEEAEDNNFSRWCANQSRDCSGCPYQKFHHLSDCETVYYHYQKFLHLSDCETAYYHDNPDDDDGIRLYQ